MTEIIRCPAVQKEKTGEKRFRLQVLILMRGDCMTCMGMYMSGVRTGSAIIPPTASLTRGGPLQARTVSYGAVAGTSPPGPAGRRTGAGTRPASGTSTSASGLLSPQVSSESRQVHRQEGRKEGKERKGEQEHPYRHRTSEGRAKWGGGSDAPVLRSGRERVGVQGACPLLATNFL